MGDINKATVDKAKRDLKEEFGETWSDLDHLHVAPYYLIKKRNIKKKGKGNKSEERKTNKKGKADGANKRGTETTGRGDAAERRLLQLASNLKEIKESPNGYFIMNAKFYNFCPENELETDGIFIHKNCIIVFEVKDKDNVDDAVNEAIPQLRERTEAVEEITEGNIPVIGAIVLPFKRHPTYCERSSEFEILYEDNLTSPEDFSDWINTKISNSNHTNSQDQIDAIAKIMHFVYLNHQYPTTQAEQIELESERITLQRHTEYQRCQKPTFNSINFTTDQNNDAEMMLEADTILSGGYGTGKTVTAVLAIKKSAENLIKDGTKESMKLNILFMSAQGFFDSSDCTLHYSPFLENAKKWVKEAIAKVVKKSVSKISVKIEDYLNSDCYSKEHNILVHFCLLTKDILESWEKKSLSFKAYDLIVLEESMALHVQDMNIVTRCLFDSRQTRNDGNVIFWITTTLCNKDFKEKYPIFEGFQDLSIAGSGLRSTLEIATLCNALQDHFSPERFPTVEMSSLKMWEGISVSYHCQFYNYRRFQLISNTIEGWLAPKERRSHLLIIDCQGNDELFNYLLENGIPICRYRDYSDSKKFENILFLQQKSDPIEAIVSGGEWSTLIFHFQYSVLYSHKAFSVINKRVLSRAISKVYMFSNSLLDDKDAKALTMIRNNGNRESYEKPEVASEANIVRKPLCESEKDNFSDNECWDVESLALRASDDSGESQMIPAKQSKRASKTGREDKIYKISRLISEHLAKYGSGKTLKIWNEEFRIINTSILTGDGMSESDLYVVEETESKDCYLFNPNNNKEMDLEHLCGYFKEHNIALPIVNADGPDDSVAAVGDSTQKFRILLDSHFVSVSFKPLLVFGRTNGRFEILSSANIEAMVIQFKEGKPYFQIMTTLYGGFKARKFYALYKCIKTNFSKQEK